MGKTYKDNPNKYRKHSDKKPRKSNHLGKSIDEVCDKPRGAFDDFIAENKQRDW